MSGLETVTLRDVEILAVGGPIYPVDRHNSTQGAEHITTNDLRAMERAAAELGDELKAPAKIGHYSEGKPAVGWLDNIRTSSDGRKLLADIRSVPRRFAQLVEAGSYRTRSVELGRYTSQRTQKTYDTVVRGLAWLGAGLPAVQTLDDVVVLYQAEEQGGTPMGTRIERLEADLRQFQQQERRTLAVPIIQDAIEEGKIAADEQGRWLEYADTFGPDTVRDLLRERRPDRSLAAANASDAITPAQDAALEQVFPGYKARS